MTAKIETSRKRRHEAFSQKSPGSSFTFVGASSNGHKALFWHCRHSAEGLVAALSKTLYNNIKHSNGEQLPQPYLLRRSEHEEELELAERLEVFSGKADF